MNLFKQKYTKTVKGIKVTTDSKKWYGTIKDLAGVTHRIPLHRNKQIAEMMLAEKMVEFKEKPFSTEPKTDETGLLEYLESYCSHIAMTNADYAKEQKSKIIRMLKIIKAIFLADITKAKLYQLQIKLNSQGLSNQTINHYTTAIKSFVNYLIEKLQITKNSPIAGKFEKLKIHEEHHERRALSPHESNFLIQAVAKMKPNQRQSRKPIDRSMCYFVALRTGLRDKELYSLTKESFDLIKNTVQIKAKNAKGRHTDNIPLPPDLLKAIKPWLETKPFKTQLFSGTYHRGQSCKTFKRDLAKARELYISMARSPEEESQRKEDDFLRYQDGQGRFIDFHALRTTYVTDLFNSKATMRQVQLLARHKDPETTLKHYAKITGDDELTNAVAFLPNLMEEITTTCTIELESLHSSYTKLTQTSGILSDLETTTANMTTTLPRSKTSIIAENIERFKEEFEVRPVGIEPTTLDLGKTQLKTTKPLLIKHFAIYETASLHKAYTRIFKLNKSSKLLIKRKTQEESQKPRGN